MNHETITACENVCRDFGSWFPPLAGVLGDIGSFLTLFVAIAALRQWRLQTTKTRNSQVALDLLVAAVEVQTLIQRVRLPELTEDELPFWQIADIKLRRLREGFGLLENLRRNFELFKLLCPNSGVDLHVNKLLEITNRIATAADGGIQTSKIPSLSGTTLGYFHEAVGALKWGDEAKGVLRELPRTLRATSEDDSIELQSREAVAELRARLSPMVRLIE